MTTYPEWLVEQAAERAEASLAHMAVCRRMSEVNRTAPSSEEARGLREQIRAYYEEPVP